jgi:FkbM family methyltransferase
MPNAEADPMIGDRIRRLLVRRSRARRLGVRFQCSADFQLPVKLRLAGQWHNLSLPNETGVRVAFIDIMLDDCYGLRKLRHPAPTIVDIGAHVGLFCTAARNVHPQAAIHAYEPNPRLEEHLKVQARAAGFNYSMCAVGMENGKISLDYHNDSVQTRSRPDPSGTIPQIAFREVVERAGGTIDFLKVDCEGAEWLFFPDRPSWGHVRNLGMEYHLWPNHSHDEVRKVIRDLGFTIKLQKRSTETYGLLCAGQ